MFPFIACCDFVMLRDSWLSGVHVYYMKVLVITGERLGLCRPPSCGAGYAPQGRGGAITGLQDDNGAAVRTPRLHGR